MARRGGIETSMHWRGTCTALADRMYPHSCAVVCVFVYMCRYHCGGRSEPMTLTKRAGISYVYMSVCGVCRMLLSECVVCALYVDVP